MLKVLVLGSGPAGLMAAHAVRKTGHDCVIVSQKRKSKLKGAQYLHAPIPGAGSGSPFSVSYRLTGTPEAYRAKVYGPGYDGTVSPEELTADHDGWDIRSTYDRLWEIHGEDRTQHLKADFRVSGSIPELIKWALPDIMISTIPAALLCYRPNSHTFRTQNIWSSEDNTFGEGMVENNTVVCNGEDSPSWYRAARIQDHTTVEWPYENRPPLPAHKLWDVQKPISTNCDCRGNFHRMGRYGKWQKGVLSHSAYEETIDLLAKGEQMALFQ